jgi:hypothetical protein
VGSGVRVDVDRFDVECDDVEVLIERLEPDLLLNCTSYYSPWEARSRPSQWTEFLARSGFGVSLPIQATFAIRLAKAISRSSRRIVFINGCYPDAVNPVLKALNLPVFCGFGNVALVAGSLQGALGLTDARRLRVLAHHLHINPLKNGADEARVWVDGVPLEGVSHLLAQQRCGDGLEVNRVIGFTAAILLARIISGERIEACVPGPMGLPGGYPVIIEGGSLQLNLPPDVEEAEAIAWNERCALADGVRVLPSGHVEFSVQVKSALAHYLPEVANGFHVSQMSEVTQRMLEMRQRLRLGHSETTAGFDAKPLKDWPIPEIGK